MPNREPYAALHQWRTRTDALRCRFPLLSMLLLSPWMWAMMALVAVIATFAGGVLVDRNTGLNASAALLQTAFLAPICGALLFFHAMQGVRMEVRHVRHAVLAQGAAALTVVYTFVIAISLTSCLSTRVHIDDAAGTARWPGFLQVELPIPSLEIWILAPLLVACVVLLLTNFALLARVISQAGRFPKLQLTLASMLLVSAPIASVTSGNAVTALGVSAGIALGCFAYATGSQRRYAKKRTPFSLVAVLLWLGLVPLNLLALFAWYTDWDGAMLLAVMLLSVAGLGFTALPVACALARE